MICVVAMINMEVTKLSCVRALAYLENPCAPGLAECFYCRLQVPLWKSTLLCGVMKLSFCHKMLMVLSGGLSGNDLCPLDFVEI